MKTTAGKLLKNNVYAYIFGALGSGKTMLPLTLSDKNGLDVGYVTAEPNGLTSIVTAGYDPNTPVEDIGQGDPFEPGLAALEAFRRDKTIKVICVDGLSVMCANAV